MQAIIDNAKFPDIPASSLMYNIGNRSDILIGIPTGNSEERKTMTTQNIENARPILLRKFWVESVLKHLANDCKILETVRKTITSINSPREVESKEFWNPILSVINISPDEIERITSMAKGYTQKDWKIERIINLFLQEITREFVAIDWGKMMFQEDLTEEDWIKIIGECSPYVLEYIIPWETFAHENRAPNITLERTYIHLIITNDQKHYLVDEMYKRINKKNTKPVVEPTIIDRKLLEDIQKYVNSIAPQLLESVMALLVNNLSNSQIIILGKNTKMMTYINVQIKKEFAKEQSDVSLVNILSRFTTVLSTEILTKLIELEKVAPRFSEAFWKKFYVYTKHRRIHYSFFEGLCTQKISDDFWESILADIPPSCLLTLSTNSFTSNAFWRKVIADPKYVHIVNGYYLRYNPSLDIVIA